MVDALIELLAEIFATLFEGFTSNVRLKSTAWWSLFVVLVIGTILMFIFGAAMIDDGTNAGRLLVCISAALVLPIVIMGTDRWDETHIGRKKKRR